MREAEIGMTHLIHRTRHQNQDAPFCVSENGPRAQPNHTVLDQIATYACEASALPFVRQAPDADRDFGTLEDPLEKTWVNRDQLR